MNFQFVGTFQWGVASVLALERPAATFLWDFFGRKELGKKFLRSLGRRNPNET